jgi:hypothetical protein
MAVKEILNGLLGMNSTCFSVGQEHSTRIQTLVGVNPRTKSLWDRIEQCNPQEKKVNFEFLVLCIHHLPMHILTSSIMSHMGSGLDLQDALRKCDIPELSFFTAC